MSFPKFKSLDKKESKGYNEEEDYVDMHRWLDDKIDFNSLSFQDVKIIFTVGLYAWKQIKKGS